MSAAVELKDVHKSFGSTKNRPRYNSQALVKPDSATMKNTNTMAPRIGPKKNGTPPMKVASSTPPERIADTFSSDTISKLMQDSAPETPAKNEDSTSCRKRTCCVL